MNAKLLARILSIVLLVSGCGKDPATEPDPTPDPNPSPGTAGITLYDQDLVLADGESQGTLSFRAAADWTISLSETKAEVSWLSVEPMSGKAGEATLTVSALPNENYEDRSALISIRSGSATQSVPVYQKKKNALILSKEIFSVPQEGDVIDLEVKSNIEFEVAILDDWIKQSQTRALTTHHLQFEVAANPEPENREGKIVIKDRASDLADTVYVYQGPQNTLALTQRNYAVSELGETIDVVLKSNVDFTVQMPAVDWIEEVQTRSLQTYKYQFRVLPNETYDGREAQIIFKDNNSMLADTVFVYQTTKDALLLTKDRYEMEMQGGTIDVEVKSNIDFEVTILDDWITQNQTRALTTHYLRFDVAANPDPENREGRIVFKDKASDLADTVHVYQARKDALVLTQRDYAVSELGETIDVVLKSNVDFTVQMPAVDWIEEVQTKSLQTYKYLFRFFPNDKYDGL